LEKKKEVAAGTKVSSRSAVSIFYHEYVRYRNNIIIIVILTLLGLSTCDEDFLVSGQLVCLCSSTMTMHNCNLVGDYKELQPSPPHLIGSLKPISGHPCYLLFALYFVICSIALVCEHTASDIFTVQLLYIVQFIFAYHSVLPIWDRCKTIGFDVKCFRR
jgi:hypothetical protein